MKNIDGGVQWSYARGIGQAVRMVGIGLLLVGGGPERARVWAAVEAETTQQKSDRLQEQAQGDLFQQWNFDRLQANEPPAGFSTHVFEGQATGQWMARADQGALSAPNVMQMTAACADPCLHLLVKDVLQYEYPDVWVGLRAEDGGGQRVGGIIFSWKDAKNFYAALVDLDAHVVELSKVVDGTATPLGRVEVKLKDSPWHVLRVQRNTIISKDFIEVSFDGKQAVSAQDQSLGMGQIGLALKGRSTLAFDNFHAVPLFSQRPLSSPGAY